MSTCVGKGAEATEMAKRSRAFISFDYDHDYDLKNLLVGQSRRRGAAFEIADWSIKEPQTGNWKENARRRIRAVDVVICLCGHHTDTARGVSVELKLAREEGKPYFLVAGRRVGTDRLPTAAKRNDKLYAWTGPNLKALIHGRR
jgi:Thoeris protein ThsB, TIR-like domain